MLSPREEFYKKNIQQFIDKDATVLICGGGGDDRKVFAHCGFRNVVVSNINSDMSKYDWSPFEYVVENAEALSFPDRTFDYVVIHEAVHHSSSPHRVLTEMYRVARRGVLAIEARDSSVMRAMVNLNVTSDYEHIAIYLNGFTGGVNNTEIPNFIFRWTEREVEKTISAFAPYAKHQLFYNYGTRFPFLVRFNQNPLKFIILKIVQPFFFLFTLLFKKQQNLFAFFIQKPAIPEDLHPWIEYDVKEDRLKFNRTWGEQNIRTPT
ncbi:MAG: class I SAM-dependent methyltransferase [Chryseolinea sp.]